MKKLQTTLMFVLQGDKILLAKKKRGFGCGRINGVGGKVEPGETVDAAMVRETQEEIGITPTKFKRVAIIDFDEYVKSERMLVTMNIYVTTEFFGNPEESDEMTPMWCNIKDIPYDNMFPDDAIWMPMILKGEKVKGNFAYDKDFNMLSHAVTAVENLDEEIFDVLDENGGFTGEVVGREEAHRNGVWHRAVALFILRKTDVGAEVLLQKRSSGKKTWPGCWDITAGGHVEAEELGVTCIIREAEEEIGVKLDESAVRYISTYRSDRKHGKIHDRHFNEYFVAFKDVDLKSLKLQKGEVDDIKWMPYRDFAEKTAAHDSSFTGKWECFDALRHFCAVNKIG